MATFAVGHAPLAAEVRPARGAKSTGMLPPFDISTAGRWIIGETAGGVQVDVCAWKRARLRASRFGEAGLKSFDSRPIP